VEHKSSAALRNAERRSIFPECGWPKPNWHRDGLALQCLLGVSIQSSLDRLSPLPGNSPIGHLQGRPPRVRKIRGGCLWFYPGVERTGVGSTKETTRPTPQVGVWSGQCISLSVVCTEVEILADHAYLHRDGPPNVPRTEDTFDQFS
jgi:hypothetical protein